MTWQLDPTHSEIGFSVRHMMVSKVRGRFNEHDVTVHLDPDQPERSRVDATIKTASLTTGDDGRDTHLRSADFFDVERYPEITFRTQRVEPKGDDKFRLEGELTIRDVTHTVVLDGEYSGPAKDPWGNQRVGFSLTGEVDREEFGLTWNQALETGGVLVGQKVKLNIEAQVLQPAEVTA